MTHVSRSHATKPACGDLDEQSRSLSDGVLGRHDTHPALLLLLPALHLQLLLVLPVGNKRGSQVRRRVLATATAASPLLAYLC